ncbi:Anthranilate synthase, aminase component, partial [hydrothermal vent metagenome]
MKKIKFKTISRKQLADTITPVGMYSKIRDKYANSLLLESSDYHSKEESFTFICIEPIITLKANNNTFSFVYKDKEIETRNIENNFYNTFEEYSKTIEIDCDKAIKSYNGFYGYISYNSIQYFETIKLNAKKAPSEIPDFQFSFFKFIIAINHFNDELTLIENIEEGEESRIAEIQTLINARTYGLYKFKVKGNESSNCTDEDFKNNVAKAKQHCKRGDVFQLVLSRQFQQKFSGDEFNVYRALRSINPSPYLFYFDYG